MGWETSLLKVPEAPLAVDGVKAQHQPDQGTEKGYELHQAEKITLTNICRKMNLGGPPARLSFDSCPP
jgi:hypothetical protein